MPISIIKLAHNKALSFWLLDVNCYDWNLLYIKLQMQYDLSINGRAYCLPYGSSVAHNSFDLCRSFDMMSLYSCCLLLSCKYTQLIFWKIYFINAM